MYCGRNAFVCLLLGNPVMYSRGYNASMSNPPSKNNHVVDMRQGRNERWNDVRDGGTNDRRMSNYELESGSVVKSRAKGRCMFICFYTSVYDSFACA